MVICALLVTTIIARERPQPAAGALAVKQEKGVSATEAFELLRQSKHLQIIALVISFAAVGAAIIEQQLNMAAAAAKGAGVNRFDHGVSRAGAALDVDHRLHHPGLADEQDPPLSRHRLRADDPARQPRHRRVSVMLLNAALWAPGLARVLDQSLRYTVDKTTREILFLPLPGGHQAEGEVVRGRDRRSRREGARRAAAARAGQAVGPEPGLAATELREPDRDGRCGSSWRCAPGAATCRPSGRASSGATSRRPKFA